jgi:hypothetical protein
MAKKIFVVFLSVLIGGLYLFSAYAKLHPVEPFEFTFVDLGISNWSMAPFIARFLIGLEFVIGLLFILNIGTRGFTSKLSIGLLVFFIGYLIFSIIKNGNDSNCGCFGEMIKMTPLESIVKNIVLIGLNLIVFKFGVELPLKKFRTALIVLIILVSFVFPFIKNPVDLSYSSSYLVKKENQFAIPLDTLINNGYINKVPESIKTGKHIVAFLSSSCPHCKIGATKLRIMKDKNPSLPIFFVINGEPEATEKFRKETKSENIPWTKLGERPFVYLAGLNLPAIYLINNSVVEFDLNYFTLDQNEIEAWLKK